jgi:phosphatidylserine decarboxylase
MKLTYASAQLLRVMPRERISRIMGQLADVQWPRPLERAVLGAYCRAYDVAMEECESPDRWASFDHFFTRRLRDGARPLAEGATWVSPADGRLESPGVVTADSLYLVKGRPYRVDELVGDPEEARRYEGGGGCVVYLSPRDYHRVHTPAAGKLVCVRSMPGDYFPVNAIGLDHVPNLFVRNRRVALAIDTESFGRVTVVMVAAMVVGRITVTGIDARDVPYGTHVLDAPIELEAGAELGMFHLGSTAVVFFEPKGFARFVANEGPIKMGQALAEAGA